MKESISGLHKEEFLSLLLEITEGLGKLIQKTADNYHTPFYRKNSKVNQCLIKTFVEVSAHIEELRDSE